MTTTDLKLAEALTRRKDLMARMKNMGNVSHEIIYDRSEHRIKVIEGVDKLVAAVKMVPISKVIEEFALYGHQLRLIDDAIQKSNRKTILRNAKPEMFCTYEDRENDHELPNESDYETGVSIASALLRRKELSGLVGSIENFKKSVQHKPNISRGNVNADIDNVVITVAKVTREDIVAQLNFFSSQLRAIDGVIQNANWTTTVIVDEIVMKDYVPSESK